MTTAGGPPLHAVVRSGAAWSLVSNAGAQLLRFGGNLLLAKLLMPEIFGLMAIVNTVLVGLHLFSDIGIGPGIIQSSRGDDPAFLNTAWTVQVLRGVALCLASCALAVPAAAFYGQPRIGALLAVSGVTALISGFNSTRWHSMYRNMSLARVSLIDLGSQAVGLVVMLLWALEDPSPWALVAGGIASSLAQLVLSFTALHGIRNHFQWERRALDQMLHFGRWIFLSTLLTFLVMQSDRLIFGKLLDLGTLGLYSIAAGIASMPSLLFSRIGPNVFFPVFSRVHNAGEDLQPVFERVRRPWLILGGWILAGLAGGGQAAIDLCYLPPYAGAGWITQLLSLAAWFGILEMTNGAGLLARGHAQWVAACSAGKLLGLLVLITVGFHLGGFEGAVIGLVASEMLRYALSAFAIGRIGLRGWAQDSQLTLWVMISAWLGWQAALFGQRAHWPPLLVALAVFVVVTLAWAPLGLPIYRDLRKRRA